MSLLRLAAMLSRGGGVIVRWAESVYSRWPRFSRSLAGLPLRLLLARAILRSGCLDFDRAGLPRGARTPLRAALALLRETRGRDAHCALLFDPADYRDENGLGPGDNLLAHYAARRTIPQGDPDAFDPSGYLRANPDVRRMRIDPVHHFVARGRFENRVARASAPPVIEAEPDFGSLARMAPDGSTVCVIIPVHGARFETLRCLHSVLRATDAISRRILVIDDASPDPALRARLCALRDDGLIDLLSNAHNLGFSATVNRGLTALAPGEDAVILNSDCEVPDGWLERLRRVAHDGARIGTVTPLSNSATILSYPIMLRDNPDPLEIDWEELDRMACALGHAPVPIPTAIGFCMYVRADCLADVGLFDAASFPRGYGEENDFCLRAGMRGWTHLAATDLFVAHQGGASFGDDRARLVEAGLAIIDQRYPAYRSDVDRFIRQDPLAPVREALDCARIRRAGSKALWHWVGECPPEADPAGLRLVLDVASRSMLIRCTGASVAPNIPALSPGRNVTSAARILLDMGIEQIRIRDPAWLGKARLRHLRAAAKAGGIRIM